MIEKENEQGTDFLSGLCLSQAAIESLDCLLDAAPPGELQENLLEVYHTYLIYAHQTLPLNFEKIAMNMYLLINCLGTLEKEAKSQSLGKIK